MNHTRFPKQHHLPDCASRDNQVKKGDRVEYHSANAPHSSSSTCCSYQKDKRAKPGDLRKNKVLSKIAEHWIKKYVHLFSPSMVMNTVVL